MTLTRLPNWRARLTAYVMRSASTPFRPGQHDCALFAAGAVEAMTGIDPAADFRGTYRTLAEGRARMNELGHGDHIEMAARMLPEVPPIMAQIGDLAVVEGEALGVVQGPMIYVLRPRGGLGLVSLTAGERAFRV